jgi:hypothetical protein
MNITMAKAKTPQTKPVMKDRPDFGKKPVI